VTEYEYDGHTYKIKRLGLSDAKECLAKLNSMGFFDNGLEALIASPDELNELERRLFRGNLHLLNEQGEWVPMGKEITESHFDGRLGAYFNLVVKCITHSFESFLGGGWATGLATAEAEPEA
jgi:hypothetical protein